MNNKIINHYFNKFIYFIEQKIIKETNKLRLYDKFTPWEYRPTLIKYTDEILINLYEKINIHLLFKCLLTELECKEMHKMKKSIKLIWHLKKILVILNSSQNSEIEDDSDYESEHDIKIEDPITIL